MAAQAGLSGDEYALREECRPPSGVDPSLEYEAI
jgi:hypothetical protein